MLTTSPSLLERIRSGQEQQAWQSFVELYTPLLFGWARKLGLNEDDASDLLQDIFTILNVAVGGTLGGSTSGLSNPGPLVVDYVRWYTAQ